MPAEHRLSIRARARCAVASGVIVCVAALALLTRSESAHADDAARAVQRTTPLPPTLTVGVISDALMPLEGTSGGKLSGFSGELLMQLLPHDGVRVIPHVFAHRDALLAAACRGELDLVMSVVPRAQYDHCLRYSAPYLERPTAVVARTDNAAIAQNPFFRGARIVVEQGSALEDELPRQYPDIRLTGAATPTDALDRVMQGQADAYVGITYSTRALMAQSRYDALSIVQLINQQVDALHFAAPNDRSTLIRYLDRRLAQLPDTAMRELRAHWVSPATPLALVPPLSASERDMLAALPPLRYGADTRYMPYMFEEGQGTLRGILPEYFSFLSRTLGVRFERVPVSGWEDAVRQANAGEIDVLPAVSDMDDRPPGFSLVHAIDSAPMVIVGRNDAMTVSALSELSGKTVALPVSAVMGERLRKTVPKIRVLMTETAYDALAAVANRRADFAITNLPVADALIRHHFPTELKTTGWANATENVGMAVSPRFAALVPLVNRALMSMPEGEQISIRNKWLSATYQLGPSAAALMAKFGPVAAIVLGALILLFIKHMQLRRENRQRRLAEETLAQQLSFQRALMESVPFPLAAKDAQHRYVAVNAAFCNMFSRTRESVLGYTPHQLGLYSVQNTAHLSDINRRAVEMDESSREELTIVTPDGQARNVLYWVEPFHLPDGQPAGTVASLVDISEIREAQARAEQLERRLREVTESLPALVYQFELPVDAERGHMVYVAGKAHATLGTQTDNLLDFLSDPGKLIHEEDRRRVLDMTLVSAQQLTPFDQQFRHICDDGSIRWLHARSIPQREADGRTVWNGYLSDVTVEREQAEALQAAKNAAESALLAKDRFLAMMSHEIRTPMNGVLGLVELLQQTRLEDEQRQMVSLVQDSGRALLHILDDILDYAKIEAGRLDITPVATDLRELFDGTVGLLASRAHEKSLAVRVNVDAAIPATVSVDSVRVRQVLFNLLSNAIKFTDHGSVQLKAEYLGLEGHAARIAIHVTDTGIGIAPEVQAMLFAPFVQAERSTTRRYGGTGLGLAISRQLAGLMGGTLEMDSAPGRGTTITLQLTVPVVSARYALPRLAGRSVRIAVEDAAERHGIAQFAAAAGLQMTADADADITFTASSQAQGRAIRVTSEARYTEGGAPAGTAALSTNPLSWHAFLHACEQALPQPNTAQARSTPSRAVPVPPSETLGAHILVAEDHPINRELIAKQLRLLGYRVTLTEDGIAALERLREDHFDALLTDCHMPHMDGFDLAEHIRKQEAPGGPRLPIIAITATTLAEEHARCRAVGMDACLLKPTTLATLQEALSSLWATRPVLHHDEAPQASAPDEAEIALTLDDLRRTLGAGPAASSLVKIFLQALDDDADRLHPLLEPVDRAALRKWAHRTGGALALLRSPAIDAEVAAFRSTIHDAPDGQIQSAGRRMTRLLTHLKQLMSALETPQTPLVRSTQVTDS